ncbi:MAG: Acetolactate synthase [Hyphomicrobiales bacterium]|nr:Acetolactate synthase [Hyphomicrobiales bacterium]
MSGPDQQSVTNPDATAWGSDVVADVLRSLGYPHAVIVPGASFRGLHDSIVNHLGNRDPHLITCLHENHAVSIADGYSRVTETPLLVILHSNVGLMNGSMAIYNAWCDRRPMLILGATGPVDAHHRRPWIDWVHTSKDQGAVVRSFVKWDDQPASAEAMVESLLRADQITRAAPHGPVYVCLDAHIQEAALNREVAVPSPARFRAASSPAVPMDTLVAIDQALRNAKRPLILAGRMSRSAADWQKRIDLAERYGATVLSSMNNAPAFPVEHALHVVPPAGDKATDAETELLAESDLIVSLDWLDLAGFLRARTGASQSQKPNRATIVHCSLDGLLANGWSMDHQALAAIDIPVLAEPDTLVAQLLGSSFEQPAARAAEATPAPHWTSRTRTEAADAPFELTQLAFAMADWSDTRDVTYARLPIGWPQRACRFRHPLDFLGKDGGGAVGTGPAHTVGAALALKGSGRIVVGVIGDGDFSMGMNALWTAANQQLPMMLVIANNGSYYNDEVHQERVAIQRHRAVENKGIGQRLDSPSIELAQIASAQGFQAHAPVTNVTQLKEALLAGTKVVEAGGCYFIDARIKPGYAKD